MESVPQPVVHVGVIGRQLGEPLELGDGLGQIALHGELRREVVKRLRIIGGLGHQRGETISRRYRWGGFL